MGEIVAYLAMSIDGYIATDNHGVQWLEEVDGDGDNGYSEFYKTIETVVMGNRTYKWFEDNMDAYPYTDKNSYVFTRNHNIKHDDHATFVNDDIDEFIISLKRYSTGDIWIVGGGEIVTHFMKQNLIDKYIITISPHILGSGIPLIVPGTYHKQLKLIDTQVYNQFVQVIYAK